MSWPIRSHRLYGATPNLGAGGPFDLATVPAGKVFLLKDWSIANRSAGVKNYNLYLKIGGAYTQFDAVGALAVGNVIGNPHRHLVIGSGESVAIETSGAGLAAITISGALLG